MLLASSGVSGSTSKQYVDDLFVSYLRTGNGTSQSVTTGFQPDLIWTKSRSVTTGHRLVDSARGAGNSLESNSTLAQQSEATGITAFNSSGYSVGADSDYNTNSAAYVDWVWKKAPKFFDIVTYTGNGASNRQIAHELGIAPGFITTKATSTTGDWNTYHRSATGDLKLNLTNTQTASRAIITAADTSTFTVSGAANTSGVQYVAYLFAHDPSVDGIIQCGSFTTDASGNATVNLGWEPQYLIVKATSTVQNWMTVDSMRGFTVAGSSDAILYPSLSNAEVAQNHFAPNVNGFETTGFSDNTSHIYLAIRRPNKPPKTGTEVYNAIARTGTGSAASITGVGFAPEYVQSFNRSGSWGTLVVDRLRGGTQYLQTAATAAESSGFTTSLDQDGYTLTSAAGWNGAGSPYIDHFFRRAPGFFDVVCYTGTGVARTVNHSLGVAPELMIVKSRSASGYNWGVYVLSIGASGNLWLNLENSAGTAGAAYWNSTPPSFAEFTVGTNGTVNQINNSYVAYLFASLPGISKVGSYVGNGSSQTINCGFTTGCRFFLVKSTSTTGNWWTFDSARGILAASDPALALNSTVAEVTSADAVDPDPSGIIVNQEATCSINASGVNYIFLAIA